MIDGVPQLVMIFAVVGGDCLPCSVSYCILVKGSKSWTHVMAEHIWSAKDLHDCLYSSHPGHGTLLILNFGGVVMSIQFSKSFSLPMGIGASFLKVLISSAS
jgi:hypothetical protein